MSKNADALPEELHLWPNRSAKCPHCEGVIDNDNPLEKSDEPVLGYTRVSILGMSQRIDLEDIQPRCPHCWGRVSLILHFERERKYIEVTKEQMRSCLEGLPFEVEMDLCRIPDPPVQTWNRTDLGQSWPECIIARQTLHSERGGEDRYEVLEEIWETYGK